MKFPSWLSVEGNKAFRGRCPTEDHEQRDFFGVLRARYPEIAARTLHPRNERKRTGRQAAREAAEGMLTGAPDIVIVGDPCVIIELKRQDHTKSRWQDRQLETLKAMQDAGALVFLALGSRAALSIVERILVNPKDPRGK